MNNKIISIGKIMVILVLIAFIVFSSIFGIRHFYKKDNNSQNVENLTQKNNESKLNTNVYIYDYDYQSLKEGGDGSKLDFSYRRLMLNNSYQLDELPSKIWEENELSLNKIYSTKFKEPNSRYLCPFDDSINDYLIYNIDNKSTVKEAFNKGWYAISDIFVKNMSVKNDYDDKKGKFDAVIKGLGKPYCVISSNQDEEDIEGYRYYNAFIIYKYDSFYLLLNYYESIKGDIRNIDILTGYLVASDDMLQALIYDNVTSNAIESYTQKYVFKNNSKFELKH